MKAGDGRGGRRRFLLGAAGVGLSAAGAALLPGCGHLVMEDAPDMVIGLVHQFLRRQYLREEHHHAHDGPVRVFLQRPSDAALLGAEEED